MSDAQATNDQIVVSGPEQQDRKLNTRVSMLLCRTRETRVCTRAANYPSVFTITEKAPTRAFSGLKEPTSAFTFKTLC